MSFTIGEQIGFVAAWRLMWDIRPRAPRLGWGRALRWRCPFGHECHVARPIVAGPSGFYCETCDARFSRAEMITPRSADGAACGCAKDVKNAKR